MQRGGRKAKVKAQMNWKVAGQLQAMYIQLHSLVSETFKKLGVGMEILEWLLQDGRGFFTLHLMGIVTEYRRQIHGETVLDEEIDLDVVPHLPFIGATLKKYVSCGKAVIEKRADGSVYLNGKKLGLRRSNFQNGIDAHSGYELCEEIENQRWPVHNATLLDFFIRKPQFWPDDFKKDEEGRAIYVHFWASQFTRESDGNTYTRFGYWAGGTVRSDYTSLSHVWNANNPAVVSEEG